MLIAVPLQQFATHWQTLTHIDSKHIDFIILAISMLRHLFGQRSSVLLWHFLLVWLCLKHWV